MQVTKAEDSKTLITECFTSDKEYIRTHKYSDKGTQACIDCTFEEIKNLPNYVLYRVEAEDKTIGMFGIEGGHTLNPFFIKPEYRHRQYVGQLLEQVRNKLNKEYVMGLYNRNPKAIEFFKNNGGEVLSTGTYLNEPVTILVFDNGSI